MKLKKMPDWLTEQETYLIPKTKETTNTKTNTKTKPI